MKTQNSYNEGRFSAASVGNLAAAAVSTPRPVGEDVVTRRRKDAGAAAVLADGAEGEPGSRCGS